MPPGAWSPGCVARGVRGTPSTPCRTRVALPPAGGRCPRALGRVDFSDNYFQMLRKLSEKMYDIPSQFLHFAKNKFQKMLGIKKCSSSTFEAKHLNEENKF